MTEFRWNSTLYPFHNIDPANATKFQLVLERVKGLVTAIDILPRRIGKIWRTASTESLPEIR